jgi:hypothetical protein
MGRTKDKVDRKHKSDKSPSGKICPNKSLTPVLGTPPQNSDDDNVGILSTGGTGTNNKLPQSDIAIDNNVAVPTGETSDNINSASNGGYTATDNNATPINKHPPGILFGVDVGIPPGETNPTNDNVDNTDTGTIGTPHPLVDEAEDCVKTTNVAVEVGHHAVCVAVGENNSSASKPIMCTIDSDNVPAPNISTPNSSTPQKLNKNVIVRVSKELLLFVIFLHNKTKFMQF